MGWIFSIVLFIVGLMKNGSDPQYLPALYFIASGLFAIAGAISFRTAALKQKKEG